MSFWPQPLLPPRPHIRRSGQGEERADYFIQEIGQYLKHNLKASLPTHYATSEFRMSIESSCSPLVNLALKICLICPVPSSDRSTDCPFFLHCATASWPCDAGGIFRILTHSLARRWLANVTSQRGLLIVGVSRHLFVRSLVRSTDDYLTDYAKTDLLNLPAAGS